MQTWDLGKNGFSSKKKKKIIKECTEQISDIWEKYIVISDITWFCNNIRQGYT